MGHLKWCNVMKNTVGALHAMVKKYTDQGFRIKWCQIVMVIDFEFKNLKQNKRNISKFLRKYETV